jgi:hypothetical protein
MYVVWGTFIKPSSPMGCLSAAEQALVAQGLQVLKGADGADYLIVGGNTAVTLTIVFVLQPGNTWMVVSASSEDPAIATQARDVIRAMIDSAQVA